jgi:hypothetical protein
MDLTNRAGASNARTQLGSHFDKEQAEAIFSQNFREYNGRRRISDNGSIYGASIEQLEKKIAHVKDILDLSSHNDRLDTPDLICRDQHLISIRECSFPNTCETAQLLSRDGTPVRVRSRERRYF